MEVPNVDWRPELYRLWLDLIDELPSGSVPHAVKDRLEAAAAGPFQRLFRWLFRP